VTDPIGQSPSQHGEGATPSRVSTQASWIREHWPSIVAGALAGFPIGIWAGISLGKGTFYVLGTLIAAGLIGLMVIALLIATAITKKRGFANTAFVLVISFFVAIAASPRGQGTQQKVSGTGTAGTHGEPAAFWSGSVTCVWTNGEDRSISEIRDFEATVSDPEVLASEKLHEMEVGIVYLDRGTVLWWGWKTGTSATQDYDWSGESAVELEGMASDGRAGRAVMTEADVVFSWSCGGGP
jgi:hypothetical protein